MNDRLFNLNHGLSGDGHNIRFDTPGIGNIANSPFNCSFYSGSGFAHPFEIRPCSNGLPITLGYPEVSNIADAILNAKNIVVVSHQRPDADAYGSSLATKEILIQLGKKVQVVNSDGIDVRYNFMPGIDQVQSDIDDREYDLVIVCDTQFGDRIGKKLSEEIDSRVPIVVLDHHEASDLHGELCHTDPSAASATELVYKVFQEIRHKIGIEKLTWTSNLAELLFAGIIGDTDDLDHDRTSSLALKIAGECSSILGADAQGRIWRELSKKDQGTLDLWNDLFFSGRIQYFGSTSKCAYVEISQKDLQSHSAPISQTDSFPDDLMNLLRGSADVIMAREISPRKWVVSLRAARHVEDQVDVAQIAQQFNGGGHSHMAAFVVDADRPPMNELIRYFVEDRSEFIRTK